MSAQQACRVEIKRICHPPRRVMRGNIERLEVMVVILNLRTYRHIITNAGKQTLYALKRACHRVQATTLLPTPRQCYIDALSCQAGIQRFTLKLLAFGVYLG